jgi:homocitrate synthase NifV
MMVQSMKGLIDSTLREGSQTVGVHFTLEQKKQIIAALAAIGVEEAEIGIATPLDEELPELVSFFRTAAGPGMRLALWCRCRPEDVRYAVSLAPDLLSLSIPGSDLLIAERFGRGRDYVLEAVRLSVREARALGMGRISLGIEDATRSDHGFLKEIIRQALAEGASRIRLSDTLGSAAPKEIEGLFRRVRQDFAVEQGVHAHNDFGMATANSLAALDAGAEWADVTVLGLGERSGTARLEELAAFLAVRRKRPYRLEHLKPLAQLVARAVNRTVEPHAPVIGERIFHCETGLHLQALLRNPSTYEPYSPELVGSERQLLFGSKIGRKEIKHCLRLLGKNPVPANLEELLRKIRDRAAAARRPFQLQELSALL